MKIKKPKKAKKAVKVPVKKKVVKKTIVKKKAPPLKIWTPPEKNCGTCTFNSLKACCLNPPVPVVEGGEIVSVRPAVMDEWFCSAWELAKKD